jgi:hypothetical protein
MRTLAIRAKQDDGYALVAALLIMVLMTSLGVWAMYASTSEARLTGNMSEDDLMFFFSEQGVDRILSHLHYLEQGVFGKEKGLGYKFQDYTDVLPPIQVIDSKSVLQFVGSTIDKQDAFKMSAWIDPKNYDEHDLWTKPLQRKLSRPLAVSVLVDSTVSGYKQAFRATVEAKSPWDFAYFSADHNPTTRVFGGICTNNPNNWYNCQTVFHHGESVMGDLYLGSPSGSSDVKLIVRGQPRFVGEVRWRNANPFDLGVYNSGQYSGSANQTAGGSSTSPMPFSVRGFKNYAREIEMLDFEPLISSEAHWFRRNADIYLDEPPAGYAYKLLFRNDLDTDNAVDSPGTVWESGPSEPGDCREEGRVASAITPTVNDGVENCPEDTGTFMLYLVPWRDGHPDERKRMLWGNSMKTRDDIMRTDAITGDVNAERYEGGSLAGTGNWMSGVHRQKGCYAKRENNKTVSPSPPYDDQFEQTFGVYDQYDIQTSGFGTTFTFMYTPSLGENVPAATGTMNCADEGAEYGGIIYIEGNVLVSGIVDGKVSIVAAGDIILDHEIELERSPFTPVIDANYNTAEEIDMLGLFATGDIIIPNSRPLKVGTGQLSRIYNDDWSDAEDGEDVFAPTGQSDTPKLEDDDGTEDIQAVMVSFGRRSCTAPSGGGYTGGDLDCEELDLLDATDISDIRNFKVGIYAEPRTVDGLAAGEPFGTNTWNDPGNDSGTLRIIGALIQSIPGRFGYDYSSTSYNWASSTCSNGGTYAADGCSFIGHNMELIYDPHLKFTAPAMPIGSSDLNGVWYGRASYEVISWEQIEPSSGAIEGSDW